MSDLKPDFELDYRGLPCPMNFVKTKLFLDKMGVGQMVRVLLDAGEPVESVSASVVAEGHEILENVQDALGFYRVSIRKV
jgi:TusA-related sulfurtransferase